MLLESYPEEKERLRKNQNFYEWVTYFILALSYSISYLPLDIPIHRAGVNILFLLVLVSTFSFYRLWPLEKHSGLIQYTIKQKFFSIQLSNHVFASLAVFFTGGIESPLWFIYILSLIAGAMSLPAWAIIVAGIESITLYLLTVSFLTPYFSGFYDVGLTARMLVVPIVSIFSIVLTYVIAKNLDDELKSIRKLANDLKEKTEQISAEKNKLSSVVTAVADGIFVLDKNTRVTFLNEAALDVFGVTKEEVINKKFDTFLVAQNPKTGAKVEATDFCLDYDLTEKNKLYGPVELKIHTKKKKEVWIRLTTKEIQEKEASDIGCIGIFQNISKEKELEEMKLDFVAMAAHELRTPLTAVRGYLSIFLEEVSKKLNKEEKGWIEKAFISTTNLAALIENLLSVSRIELKSLKLEITAVGWEKLLGDTLETFRSSAEQKNIKLSLEIEDKLPKVYLDKFRITEVISNLLANAINYTKVGGKVDIYSWVEDGYVYTSIQDNGEGIPESAIPKLFMKFFRVSGVLEQGSKGTGLGLYISKAIVDMHKGKIWVKSKLGFGTTFTFKLPLNDHKKRT